jgi:hypothetical protein
MESNDPNRSSPCDQHAPAPERLEASYTTPDRLRSDTTLKRGAESIGESPENSTKKFKTEVSPEVKHSNDPTNFTKLPMLPPPARSSLRIKPVSLDIEILRKTSKQVYHAASHKPSVMKSEEGRSDIAFMLDQATRFAEALKENMGGNQKEIRPCALSPLLSPAVNALPRSGLEEQSGMPPRHRYRRRNSFVIHRNGPGGLLLPPSVACQKATFPTPKLVESMGKTGSSGLTQH